MSRIYEALRRAEAEQAAPLDQWASALTVESSPSCAMLDAIPARPWSPQLPHLPAVHERGQTVEQLRTLRSRMQELRATGALKSVLVTSGLPQEGKSFIAVNLALSLARHSPGGVLLIDGDMRRASLHTLLGCPHAALGLTEYLAGQAAIEQILQRPAAEDLPLGFASLVFLGAGSQPAQAADLSGNRRFESLLATLAPLFDWVIVDSSPVNLVSDAANLARACDGVLLIARGAVTRFESAQRAVAALDSAKILGFVLNAVHDSTAAHGYYDYDSKQ